MGSRKSLSRSEAEQVQKALLDYPGYADTLVDTDVGIFSAHDGDLVHSGYAYLVRKKPGTPMVLEVTPSAAAKDILKIRVQTSKARSQGDATAATPFRWRVPDDGPFPQLVEVRFPKSGKRRRGAVSVRTVAVPLSGSAK